MFPLLARTSLIKTSSTNALKRAHKFLGPSTIQLSTRLKKTVATNNTIDDNSSGALIYVKKTPTKSALKLAYRAICSKPGGISTHEVFKVAVEYEEKNPPNDLPTEVVPGVTYRLHAGPFPPRPECSIHSMRHLKRFVLPWLEELHVIEKFRVTVELSEEEIKQRLAIAARKTKKKGNLLGKTKDSWLWRLKKDKPLPPKELPGESFGAEVGLGRDWSHLNKRRQIARQEKIQMDISWLKDLQAIKLETMKAETGDAGESA